MAVALNVNRRPPEQVSQIGAIRHQRARRWKESEEADRRQTDKDRALGQRAGSCQTGLGRWRSCGPMGKLACSLF
jgi:hypothetical protein